MVHSRADPRRPNGGFLLTRVIQQQSGSFGSACLGGLRRVTRTRPSMLRSPLKLR